MSLLRFFQSFGSRKCRSRRKQSIETWHPRFEELEDRCLLSGTEIPEAENPPALPEVDVTGMFAPIGGNFGGLVLDEGNYYWHFDEQIPLLRAATEYLVQLAPSADPMAVIEDLTGSQGPLSSFSTSVFSGLPQSLLLQWSPSLGPLPDPEDVEQDATSIEGVAWTAPIFVGADSGSRVYLTDRIAVALAPEVDPEDFFAEGFSSWYRFFDNHYIATVSAGGGLGALDIANNLSSDPDVEWAAPNFYTDFTVAAIPDDPLFSGQWNLVNTGQNGAKIGADAKLSDAWDITTGGFTPSGSPNSRVVIAVLDNGVQLDHPDLDIFTNTAEIPGNGIDDDANGYIDDVNGWDFAGDTVGPPLGTDPDNNPNPTTEDDNHGTAVAGVVAALGDNDEGIAGAAWDVQILPIKIARDDTGGGGGFVDAEIIARAVYYAAGIVVDNCMPVDTWRGADILVNSWGGGLANPLLTAAFDYVYTNGRDGLGTLSFVASGNFADGQVPQLKYQVIDIPVTPGQKQYIWSYQTNADTTFLGENRAWIADITLPNGTQELLDTDNNLSGWSSSGQAWTIPDDPTHGYGTARYVARSALMNQASQQSNLWSPVINVTSSNTLSFARYVSSQLQFDQFGNPLVDALYLYEITNGGPAQVIWADAGNPMPIRPVSYPANLGSTIAVGASTDWDYRAAYSQFGPTLDFVAPSGGGYAGVSTTDRTGSAGYAGGDYVSGLSGTSFSTPLAAGIAALMVSKNPSLTAADVRSIMRATADKIGGDIGLTEYLGGMNQYYGFGRVNAAAALAATPWPGDYNDDSSVDAADYTVWRDHFGQSVVLPNDITPGTVDESDFNVWKAYFGATSTTLPSGALYVPGDYSFDGIVDTDDYAVWEANFGSTTNLDADGNFDGIVDLADFYVWQEMRGVTTMEVIAGDFNGDGIVDMADRALWEAQDPLADANGDEVVNEHDLAIWEAHFGIVNAGVFPSILIGSGGPPLKVPYDAPRVTAVRLSGSGSAHDEFDFASAVGSGEQLRSVPVGGLDTIAISFSEEVYVTADALTLYGLNYDTVPDLLDFSYDLQTQTAEWVFDTPLVVDQYLMVLSDSIYDLDLDLLDGEFTNPWSLGEASGYARTFPSGDGEAGGQFRFRFTNLPGDFTGDNIVDTDDYNVWDANEGMLSGAGQRDGDADGDGDVDNDDYSLWAAQSGEDYTAWLSIEEDVILVSTLADENDANYDYGDLSLREAIGLADAMAGAQTLIFDPFLSGTITLSLGQLTIDSDVEIAGPGANLLTINGDNTSRVFNVTSGTTATIRDLRIADGYTDSTNGNKGAGVYTAGYLTLQRVAIEENEAALGYGGGIYVDGGSLDVLASTIADNYASHGGGGIYLTNSPVATILNSTISSNTTLYNAGGGIDAGNASLTIIQSTVTQNRAISGFGGGIHTGGNYVVAQNSIFADNFVGTGNTKDDIDGELHEALSRYNLIGVAGDLDFEDGYNGNMVGVEDAGLAPLGYYGGPTRTHALLDDSAAIDAGDNALALAFGLDEDQRGEDRIVDWDGVGGDHIDIGAVELALGEVYS